MNDSKTKGLKKWLNEFVLILIFLLANFIIQPSMLTCATHVSGRISKNTVWKLQNHPYIVDSSVYVYGNSPDEVVTLTIEAGVEVRFKDRAYLQVGASYYYGRIAARGTKDKPIKFTPVSKTPGIWGGIYFANSAPEKESILKYCIIEFGGSYYNSNICIQNSSPGIKQCTIRKGSQHGIRIYNNKNCNPQINGCTISKNEGNAIHCDGNQPTPLIAGNNILKNTGCPIAIGAHAVTNIAETNRMTENGKNSIYVYGDRLSGNHTWKAKLPYIISGNVSVYGDRDGEPASLEIMPGTTLQFADQVYLSIGSSSTYKGILAANGTQAKPITFTAVSKKPGAWQGIYFADGTVDEQSILKYCIVEFGGYATRSNIYIENSSPTIHNCTIRKGVQQGICINNSTGSSPQIKKNRIVGNGGNAIHCDGNRPTPLIAGNIIKNNTGHPIAIGAHALGKIDMDNRMTDNGSNSIYVYGDYLKGKHYWRVTIPCIITGTVNVYGDRDKEPASLELLPGTTLQFADRVQLRIGSSSTYKGILAANGTQAKPITFTSASRTPGAWYGLYFADGTVDEQTILKHCIVELGGYYYKSNIYIENSSPTIHNCIIRKGTQHGIRINNSSSSPRINDCIINKNEGNGIHSDGNRPTPGISGNTIKKNTGYPIVIGAHAVTNIDETNQMTDNGKNSIYVLTDRLVGNHTWKVNLPCIISGHINVYGDRDAEPASLELKPGTTLQFNDRVQFRIGYSSNYKGILTANGTKTQPVTFTSASQTPGAWYGLYFADGTLDGKTTLKHCIVELGGYSFKSNIYIENSSPTIHNCIIRKGTQHGIRINNSSSSNPRIDSGSIAENGANGIHCDGNRPTPVITGNIIKNNTGYPIAIGAHAVTNIDETNQMTGNGKNSIYVHGDRLVGDHTWKVTIPCMISNNVSVYGDRDAEPASLELRAGTTLQFANGRQLSVGYGSTYKGILAAKGTRDHPVTFTGVSQTPGAWRGIYFNDGAVDGKNILDHCTVEYGGGGLQGSIYIHYCSLTIANSVIRKSSSYGIYSVRSPAGVYNSSILDNNGGGIYHYGSGTTAAEYNWWGDPTGPSGSGPGSGSSVSNSVDYDPWLTRAPNPGLYVRNISVSPDTFSNNGGNTNFQVLFSASANWGITIYGPDNSVVKNHNGIGSYIDWKWPGLNNQGTPLQNGKYKFVLAGNNNALVTGFVRIQDTYALAEITSPGAGRIVPAGSDITIKGTAKGTGFQSYTLEYGEGYNPAAWTTLVTSTTPVDNNNLSTTPVHISPAKNYIGVLRLRVQNSFQEETIFKRFIDIMSIADITVQNGFFSPNNDQINDQTVINTYLNFPGPWQLNIITADDPGKRVRTFTGYGGVISRPWDGTDENGVTAPNSHYRYEVSALHPFSGEKVIATETAGTLDTVLPGAKITSPLTGAVIANTRTIKGTAADQNLYRWRLELGEGQSPDRWTTLYESDKGVMDGTLTGLDTRDLDKVLYTLQLQSWDLAGNRTSVRSTVKVLTIKDPLEELVFSPNGDGKLDTVTLSNGLTIPGDWKILIVNKAGQIVRRYQGSGESIVQTWDGKDKAGQTAADGLYTARVKAWPTGKQSPRINRDVARVSLDNTPPQVAFHNPVKDGFLFNEAPIQVSVIDTNLLSYTLSFMKKSLPGAFYELHTGDRPVQNQEVCSLNTYVHPNGGYIMRLDVEDRVMNRKLYKIPFRIDNIVISNVSNTPVFFNPLRGKNTQIKYEIDRNAYITIEMLQRDPVTGDLLAVKATPYKNAARNKGLNSDPWGGKGDDGQVLPLTYYPYRITAKKGKRIRVYDTPFITGKFEPSIGGATFMIRDIGMVPNADGLGITYKLEKNTRVDIQIGQYRREGLFHHLMQDVPLLAGEQEVTWSMRDDQGKLVRPQIGRFELSLAIKGIPLPDNIAVTTSRDSPVTNVRVDNLMMQPNYDETASLYYTLGKNVDKVTLDIVDPNGNHFRSLKGPVDASTHNILWDGRDDNGRLGNLPGDYRFTLRVIRAGKKDTIRKGAFILRGYHQFDPSGVHRTPGLVIIEVRNDEGKLIGIETQEKK
jgi:flagellar hook assembly protein FlgD